MSKIEPFPVQAICNGVDVWCDYDNNAFEVRVVGYPDATYHAHVKAEADEVAHALHKIGRHDWGSDYCQYNRLLETKQRPPARLRWVRMRQKRLTRPQLDSLESIHGRHGGVCPSSDWTNGSGRYTSRKTVPPFCRLMTIWEATQLPGFVGKAARRLHKDRPRVEKVVAVVQLRWARRALKEGATSC